MRRLLLKCPGNPTDVLMLTAAVRELHSCYPGQFLTGVSTMFPELWECNPHIAAMDENGPNVRVVECQHPLIYRSDGAPWHLVCGFVLYLNEVLDLNIEPTLQRGDIHLSVSEKAWMSQVQEMTGDNTPFWIVAAGGSYDETVKWWEAGRYQQVIDHFEGRIQFVLIGESRHYNPNLNGVIDLRGKTNTRQLVRLMHHAQGVLCGVGFLMHLAAAVEAKPGRPRNRAAVIVAGGSEPTQWQAYARHQYLHTLGALPCCRESSCGKSRTLPLGDGSEKDGPQNLCVDVAGDLPRCMAMISARDVIRKIEMYYDGGNFSYLTEPQYEAARKAVAREFPES